MASNGGPTSGTPGGRLRRASAYYTKGNDKVLQQIDSKVLTNTMQRPSQVAQLSHAHRISDRGTGKSPLPPVSHETMASWNFQFSEKALADELQSLLSSLKRCLELRADYMAWSLQRIGDNPKDSDSWESFPPPPRPSYTKNDKGEFVKLDSSSTPETSDFDMAKIELPGPDTVSSSSSAQISRIALNSSVVW